MEPVILAIDQGTTSSRTLAFNKDMKLIGSSQKEFRQYFPKNGWVEHDPIEIYESVLATSRAVIERLPGKHVVAIGITNQRETTILWDKNTGQPVYPAIVWQDRRTAQYCEELRLAGFEAEITKRTGLLLDPYFSATKIAWILENVDGAKDKAKAGELAFGTVDSWLIWKLTGGKLHATDATNAARTMLYDIHRGEWSLEICEKFQIPLSLLPEVRDCDSDYDQTSPDIFGISIPIKAVAGDQQAAALGQGCFKEGMIKSTYGTGCFVLLNTGTEALQSKNRLLTTIAYQLNGKIAYALEGSIFTAGAVVQWLRDGLKLIDTASDTEPLAAEADPEQNLILVPAFTGLGAPYWHPTCRGALFGLTRNSGSREIAKAALRSVGFQTRDLLEAMRAESRDLPMKALRVDGGMTASNWTMQFVADMVNLPLERPDIQETTALGAAWLAGQSLGIYPDMEAISKNWVAEKSFEPKMAEDERKALYGKWKGAVRAAMDFSDS